MLIFCFEFNIYHSVIQKSKVELHQYIKKKQQTFWHYLSSKIVKYLNIFYIIRINIFKIHIPNIFRKLTTSDNFRSFTYWLFIHKNITFSVFSNIEIYISFVCNFQSEFKRFEYCPGALNCIYAFFYTPVSRGRGREDAAYGGKTKNKTTTNIAYII